MKFIANENIPLPSIKLLREKSYCIFSVSEESAGISDSKVLEIASAQNLILLTFDRDYSELIFMKKEYAVQAAIYLRFKPFYPIETGEILIEFIKQYKDELPGYFWVIERNMVRRRELPGI